MSTMHQPLPSVTFHYPGDLELGRGKAPGGYDTCYPGCPGCASADAEPWTVTVARLIAEGHNPWPAEEQPFTAHKCQPDCQPCYGNRRARLRVLDGGAA